MKSSMKKKFDFSAEMNEAESIKNYCCPIKLFYSFKKFYRTVIIYNGPLKIFVGLPRSKEW